MPKFLNATQALGEIESILTRATERVIMISPFIRIHDDLITRLTDAGSRRRINMTIVCREKDLRDAERRKLEQVPNLALRFNDRVHAKCYYNEESMVIASSNLYESSQGDNHEIGILLSGRDEEDKSAFHDAVMESQFIIRESTPSATKVYVASAQSSARRHEPNKVEPVGTSVMDGIARVLGLYDDRGYCIKCQTRIDLNREAPYCPDCYRVWAKYRNPDYDAEFCHSCGRPAKTKMNRPLCSVCYSKHKVS